MLKIVAVGMEGSHFSKKSQLPLCTNISIKKCRSIICILFGVMQHASFENMSLLS